MKILYILMVFLVTWASHSEGRLPPLFFDVREPPVPIRAWDSNARAVAIDWIKVPLDHFSSEPSLKFDMRYMTNDQFFVEDGSPVFIFLGGEWSISAGWLLGGHMYEIARDVGGYMIYTEHRYYGRSWPVPDTKSENLKYLVVDQALADVIILIKELKQEPRFSKSKFIVFGASYAGNMAQWIRDKYPEYIDGALASSGPVLAKADFFEYLENVNDAIRDYGGEECLELIRRGVAQTREAIDSGDLESVQKAFTLCNPLNVTNELDVQTFFSSITYSFSGSVQTGSPASLRAVCNNLQSFEGNDMQKLGRYINPSGSCFDTKYEDTVQYYTDTTFNNENIYTIRLWLYQTCTEYGYYQTTNSTDQPFGPNKPLSYYSQNLCKDLYGPEFTEERLEAGVERTNRVYGGLTPNITKVFTVHGTIDPWHRLGILEDINEESPTVLIKGTSHCVDLQGSRPDDIPELTQARARIRKSVMEWISN